METCVECLPWIHNTHILKSGSFPSGHAMSSYPPLISTIRQLLITLLVAICACVFCGQRASASCGDYLHENQSLEKRARNELPGNLEETPYDECRSGRCQGKAPVFPIDPVSTRVQIRKVLGAGVVEPVVQDCFPSSWLLESLNAHASTSKSPLLRPPIAFA